jgi:tetratricopeptide (TPR) repeat protein
MNLVIPVSHRFQWLNKLSLLAVLMCSGVASAATSPTAPQPTIIPIFVRMQVPEARLPIKISKVDVHTEVLGSAAHTRVEMVFFNPNERQLEGELQFPLLEGQTVTGFALDIKAELRAAVPVEKEKGQEVFEDVSRARIDPALLEKTQGNNYKLRVYPLPAHGSRRVVIELDEALSKERDYYLTYRLPLQFAAKVEQLDIAVHNATSPALYSAMAVSARMGAERIKVVYGYHDAAKSGALVKLSRKDYMGKEVLSIDFPAISISGVAIETRDNQTYFYTELDQPAGKETERPAPKNIGIVWDASGSGAARDHGREFDLLDAYFKTLKNVRVDLLLARDETEEVQQFRIVNGDWHVLRLALEQVVYDGASNKAAFSPPQSTQLNLLFSDGLMNYGNLEFIAGTVPLYTVNAASSSDLPRLRAWAEHNGGHLLNLLSLPSNKAVQELTHQSPHLVGLFGHGVTDLVTSSDYAESGRIKIAGILTNPEASIQLDWVMGQSLMNKQVVQIKNTTATTLAANRWATLKLAKLEADYSANRGAIRRLGKQFNLVTRETSLIVLDRLEDYVRYEIVPPQSLREEYERLLALKNTNAKSEHSHHLDEVAGKFQLKKSWWEKDFPKGEIPKLKTEEVRSEGSAPHITAYSPPPREYAEAMGARRNAMAAQRTESARAQPLMMASPSPATRNDSLAGQADSASIRLKKWEPDSTYAKRLRQATLDQMYSIYLDERPSYTSSTAFFLDAADIFIERGQTNLGLRILSNLAEMNLENRHIMRILAYRLLQAKQPSLAVPILQQVLALSPNEPQSWRDLGLAYAENGKYQKAIDNLWEVVSRTWDSRFPDIELIALNELNVIVAKDPKRTVINTSRMDERLLVNLPLDIRAVLAWDSDNADIDLWVTDPNGEKVYYANRLGYQGGSLSSDFTGGYGPEEFSLRLAKPGKYKVQAHFFGNHQQIVSGATTLMLRFSTGFGTSQQKDENVIVRLTGQGEDVEVGTFEVKNP